MAEPDPIQDALERWQELLRHGRDVPPEELLPNRPELWDVLRRRQQQLRKILGVLNEPAAEPQARCLPAVEGYEMLGELGRGGMGIVYKARHRQLNRVVALKLIGTRWFGSGEQQRLRTEAEAQARLHHPNVVQIFDIIPAREGFLCLALELVEGGTLAEQLDHQPQAPLRAAGVVESLARAIHAAHRQRVLHRDLKPANILLTRDGQVKISDFGLAKKLDDAAQTPSGALLGTPSYMAPEQAGGGGGTGPETDVYGLGAVLYEMLTGRPPFLGPALADTLVQVREQEPVPPRRLQPGLPRDLDTICLKCLHKERAGRYATAEELAEDLRRFQAGEAIRARPVSRVVRAAKWLRRRPLVTALLLALLVVSLVGVAALGWALRGKNEALEQAAQEDRKHKVEVERKNRELEEILDRSARFRCFDAILQAGRFLEHDPQEALSTLHDYSVCPLHLRYRAWHCLDNICRRLQEGKRTTGKQLKELESARLDPAPAGARDAVGGLDVSGVLALADRAREGQLLFNADGVTLTAVTTTGEVCVWKRSTKPSQVLDRPKTAPRVRCLAESRDGALLALGTETGTIEIWGNWPRRLLQRNRSTAPILDLTFPDDSQTLVAVTEKGGCVGGSWTEWDARTGAQLREVECLGDHVRWLGFCGRDGAPLFGSSDGRVWLGDGVSENVDALARPSLCWETRQVGSHSWPVRHALARPDGKLLLTVGVQTERTPTPGASGQSHWVPQELQLYDPSSMKERWRLKWSGSNVHLGECFSADGLTLVTASAVADGQGKYRDSELHFWDVSTRQQQLSLKLSGTLVVGLAFAPDDSSLALHCLDGSIRLFDLGASPRIATFAHLENVTAQVAFAADGQTLWASCEPVPGQAARQAVRDGERQPVGGVEEEDRRRRETLLQGPDTAPAAELVAVEPAHFRVFGGGRWTQWRLQSGETLRALEDSVLATCRAFGPRGRWTASAYLSGEIHLRDVASARTGRVLKSPENSIFWHLAFSADERLLAAAGAAGPIYLYDESGDAPAHTLTGHCGRVLHLVHVNDQLLASVGSDGAVRFWDVISGKSPRSFLASANGLRRAALSADAALVAWAEQDGSVWLSRCDEDRSRVQLGREPAGVAALAFAPDGRSLAVGGQDGTLRLWDVGQRREVALFRENRSPATGLAFSPDGARLSAAHRDGVVQVFGVR